MPVLKVARKWAIPYEDALTLYDFYLRRAKGPSWNLVFITYSSPIHSGVRNELAAVAAYWYPVFHNHLTPTQAA